MIINIKVNNMTGGSRMAAAPQQQSNPIQQMENNNAKILALDKQINNLQQQLRRLNMNVDRSAMNMYNLKDRGLSGADLQTVIGELQGEWSSNTLKASQVKTQLKTLKEQINTLREQNRILLGQLTRSPSSRSTRRKTQPGFYKDLTEADIENTAPYLDQGISPMKRSPSAGRNY